MSDFSNYLQDRRTGKADAHFEEGPPSMPKEPVDVLRYVPPLVEVDLNSSPVALSLRPSRLDLATSRRAGRERVKRRLEQARADFAVGETWELVKTFRRRHAAARERLEEASLIVRKAIEEHVSAAAEETADAGKLWKKLSAARDGLAAAEATRKAVASQMDAAEVKAKESLALRMAAAVAAERKVIADARERIQGELLDALRAKLEALALENDAASELARRQKIPALLPNDEPTPAA